MKLFPLHLLITILLLSINNKGITQIINTKNCTETNRLVITPFADVFKSSSILPIDSVLHKPFTHFADKPVIFSGYDPYYYWVRFIINNNDSVSRQLMLLLGPLAMKKAELFQKKNGQWVSIGKTGHKYAIDNRPYEYAHFVFPVSIPAKQLDTLYLQMDINHDYKVFAFALLHPIALKTLQNKVYFQFGIIIGLLLLFCVFNLYLYFSNKDVIHVWYALYILTLIFVVMKNDSLDHQFLGFDSETAYRLTSIMGFAALAIAIYTHVIQLFLQKVIAKTKLYKVIYAVKVNLFISAAAQLFTFYIQPDYTIENIVFFWANISSLLAIIVIFISCVVSITKGYKLAYFVVIGSAIFMIGSIERLLLISDTSYLFPPYIFHVGIIIEIMIISFGLIYRSNTERREKFRYLKEKEQVRVNLENKILESKFEIQHNTLKNISSEINDNIRPILIQAKANLSSIHTTHKKSEEKIRNTNDILERTMEDLSGLSNMFNKDVFKSVGLVNSIRFELDLIKKSGKFEIDLSISEKPFIIPQQKELILFRIVQEALQNIIKHSEANTITVSLKFKNTKLTITIADNGKGFDTNKINLDNAANYGSGLLNLSNRAESIGAQLEVKSNSKGSTVIINYSLN